MCTVQYGTSYFDEDIAGGVHIILGTYILRRLQYYNIDTKVLRIIDLINETATKLEESLANHAMFS